MDSAHHEEVTTVAKVIGPLHSAEARGRVAGLIFNTWRGISYVKAFCSPAQPRSKKQLAIRSITIRLVRYWQTLSSGDRAAWNQYAVDHPDTDWTGNPKRLTGLNWFVRCSVGMLRLGATFEDSPPAVPAPDSILNFAAPDGVLESVLTWTATAGTDLTVDIWRIGPHSAGIQQKIERARLWTFSPGEGGTVTADNLLVGVYTFFARAISELDGLVSPWVSDTAVITAA